MSKATIDITPMPAYLAYVQYHNSQGELTELDYYLCMEITNQLIAHIGRIEAKNGGFIIPGQPEKTIYPTFEEAGWALYRQWQAPKPASGEAVEA